MNEYYKSSDYYPDDKDIYDFLSSTGAPHPGMVDFLADYGIFCSFKNNKDDIQKYLSYLFLSWPKAGALLEMVDNRDTEEHLTTSDVEIVADMDTVRAAIEAVKNLRSKRDREHYDLKFGTNEVEATITYIYQDTSKTRVLQKRERQVELWVTIKETSLQLRHTNNNATANKIVENFLGLLAEKNNAIADKLKPRYISFDKITSASARVQFFKDMMTNIPDFSWKDVTNIKVGKIPKHFSKNTEDDDDEIDADEAVSKVIIYGTRLFSTNEFQNLVAKGFFITAATWKSEYAPEAPDQVEFVAGFSDPETCKLFGFKATGKYLSIDGVVQSKRDMLPASSAKAYTTRLEVALRSAFESATVQPAATPPPTPASPATTATAQSSKAGAGKSTATIGAPTR
ncbi:MAG: hypothetical protein NTV51_10185 [Verrucomicrobia bacterium]|nr:hypothetical protein [Verrucomicrobiota bacterium]